MSFLVYPMFVFVAAMEALTIVLWAIGRIPAADRWLKDHEPQISARLPWRVLLCMGLGAGVISYLAQLYYSPIPPPPGADGVRWAITEAVGAFLLIAVLVPIGGLIFYKRGASIGQVLAAVIGGQGLAWEIASTIIGTLTKGGGQRRHTMQSCDADGMHLFPSAGAVGAILLLRERKAFPQHLVSE